MEEIFRVAVSGHRPGVLARSHIDPAAAGRRIARAALTAARRRSCRLELRVGGALGIDRAAADAGFELRAGGESIRIVVCLPFPIPIMAARWSPEDRARLEAEVAAADAVEGPESETYTVSAYMARNRRLLEGADILLACWNGDPEGGTADAIRAATLELGRPARNEQWGFRRISPSEASKTGRLTRLPANAFFVFGSNTAGRHGAGAARDAARYFGAAEGVAEGRTGQAYAIPTVVWRDKRPGGPVEGLALRGSLESLIERAQGHPEFDFVMTDVGAGLAGMSPAALAAAWAGLVVPENLLLTPAQRSLIRGPLLPTQSEPTAGPSSED